jgi:hypothetical protein
MHATFSPRVNDPDSTPAGKSAGKSRSWFIGLFLLSALYFADTLLRASLKTFWYDELVTVYLCRMPSLAATWSVVLHGVDFNPPLFYLLTRISEALFGEGLIATRLPAIIGFWIMGLSLYAFVARRLGPLYGAIAALAPPFTLAYYYAYEARPHGIVLAWCGLMLLCWQRGRQTPASRWLLNLWLWGLLASFLAALLTHIYAFYLVIPFLLAETYALLRRKSFHLGVWLALLLPLVLVAPLYLNMSRRYKSLVSVGGVVHPDEAIRRHLVVVYGPALALLLIAVALLAWAHRDRSTGAESSSAKSLTREELIVASGLILLPVIGMIGVRITHGPFFDRYFIASTVGFALLLAQSIAILGRNSRVAQALFAAMLLLLAGDTALALYGRVGHRDLHLVEPSSGFAFPPDPAQPLVRNQLLLDDRTNLDILVLREPEYLFLVYYAPPPIRRRLVFGAPGSDDIFMRGYRSVARWTHTDLRTATYDQFFATHPEFLVYSASDGLLNGACWDCTEQFIAVGYTLRSVARDPSDLLEHFSK